MGRCGSPVSVLTYLKDPTYTFSPCTALGALTIASSLPLPISAPLDYRRGVVRMMPRPWCGAQWRRAAGAGRRHAFTLSILLTTASSLQDA